MFHIFFRSKNKEVLRKLQSENNFKMELERQKLQREERIEKTKDECYAHLIKDDKIIIDSTIAKDGSTLIYSIKKINQEQWIYVNKISDSDYDQIGHTIFRCKDDKTAVLDYIMVHEGNRKYQIGTQLINYVISYTRKNECLRITGKFSPDGGWTKENVEGLKIFYSKNGFSIDNFDEWNQSSQINMTL